MQDHVLPRLEYVSTAIKAQEEVGIDRGSREERQDSLIY